MKLKHSVQRLKPEQQVDVRLMEAGLRRNLSHLDVLQLGQHLLSLLVHLTQVSLQLLHLLLQMLERFLHLGRIGHLGQQSGIFRLLVPQNAGEDASVDVQGGAHQLHVIASLQ